MLPPDANHTKSVDKLPVPGKDVVKPRSLNNMSRIIPHALLWLLCVPALLAGIPEIGRLKPTEQLSITVVYSEPVISEHKYVFSAGKVTLIENGKLLGKLTISAEDAGRIDQHLLAVQRGKKASRRLLGAPGYTITHEDSGKTLATWDFRIEEPKKTDKPELSLRELKKRLP
jgi:hypothetical protein